MYIFLVFITVPLECNTVQDMHWNMLIKPQTKWTEYVTTQQDLLIAQYNITSITQKFEKLCGIRFNFRGNSRIICTQAVGLFFETDKGKTAFQYYPAVFINQCLHLFQIKHNFQNTAHSTAMYCMFRPFWPSLGRF